MSVSTAAGPGASSRWRRATLALAGLLVVSWVWLGYALVDSAVSLDHCRAEQAHLKHDIQVFVEAVKGNLGSGAFLSARVHADPELPQRLAEGNTSLLERVVLKFGPDLLLQGSAEAR
jgi:hypothetical protein